jgi:hypothetical protein
MVGIRQGTNPWYDKTFRNSWCKKPGKIREEKNERERKCVPFKNVCIDFCIKAAAGCLRATWVGGRVHYLLSQPQLHMW